MNTKMIAGLVVAGVVIVGGIFAFASRSTSDTDDDAANTSNQSQSNETSTHDGSGFPNQILFGDQSYVVTVTTQDSAEPSNNAELSLTYDNANLWSTDVTTSEGSIKTVFAGDATYVQSQGGAWTKFPAGNSGDTSIEGYTFSDSDVEDFRTYANHLGKESCSLGTCDVWEVTDNQVGANGKMWIGSDNRLARAILTEGTMTTELNYDYDTATNVEIPKNFEEFNIPTEGGEIDLDALNDLTP